MARVLYTGTRAQTSVRVEQRYCKGCDLCVRFCPPRALRLSDAFSPAGFHYPLLVGECTGCKVCEVICPDFAIIVVEA